MSDVARRFPFLFAPALALALLLLSLSGMWATGPLPADGMPVADAFFAASPLPDVPLAAPSVAVTYTVTTTADSGAGSLREAITLANGSLGPGTIVFAISSDGPTGIPRVIDVLSQLPVLTAPMTIRGPNSNGAAIWLDGGGGNYHGLSIGGASATVRGLTIRNFAQYGIRVQDNTAGVLIAGNSVTGNGGTGVGGGILIRDSVSVVVGGDTAADRNVISGNQMNGLQINGGGGNVARGNYIGLNYTGVVSQGNQSSGVYLSHTSNNTIGGDTAGRRNVIAGNGTGVTIYGEDSSGNLVQGNYVGVDASGATAIENERVGIWVYSTLNTTIGGSAPGQGNLISGNGQGIYVQEIEGGAPPTDTSILGNLIGTNAAGTEAIPNGIGIHLERGGGHVIGGAAAGAGNLISGNTGYGILLRIPWPGTGEPFVTIKGNRIGVKRATTAALGNGGQALRLEASDVTVGGIAAGEGNVIAHSGEEGVMLFGYRNAIRGNAIYENGGLGIDLSPGAQVNLNDPGDADEGANRGQNYPDLLNVVRAGSTVTVSGRLVTTATTLFELDFYASAACDPTGYGEGQLHLASRTLTMTQDNMPFTTPISGVPPELPYLTATATDPEGNTSEFSACYLTVVRSQVFLPLVSRP